MKITTPEIEKLARQLRRTAESAAALEKKLNEARSKERARIEAVEKNRTIKRNTLANAEHYGIEVDDEVLEFDRISVWPPESIQGEQDPHDFDHYVYTWADAFERVKEYAAIIKGDVR